MAASDDDGLDLDHLEPELDELGLRLQAQRLLDELFGIDRATRLGRYELRRVLGRGGMGTVYVADDHRLQRQVAIKTLSVRGDAELERRLEHEARAMAQLSHPNLVVVHDLDYAEGHTFIVMEYIDGHTLGEWLGQQPRGCEAILEVFAAAGEGLAAAHDAGVIHRDFKPSNVMVDAELRARVMDFGLAELDPSMDATVACEAEAAMGETIAGTPRYMAPEQVRGHWVDARSDQYAFCVALYEAVYGEHPYGVDRATIWAAAERGELCGPPPGSDVPGWLRELLRRGLTPNATKRFASMRALLVELVAGDPQLARPDEGRLMLRVVFSAAYEFDEFDERERERIRDLLRIVTRDPDLSIEQVSPGSVVLLVMVSTRGAEALKRAHERGELGPRLGVEIQELESLQGTDLDLVWRSAKGDAAASVELFEAHGHAITRFFRGKARWQEIDELIRETWSRVLGGVYHIRDPQYFRAYVMDQARNVLREHVREKTRTLAVAEGALLLSRMPDLDWTHLARWAKGDKQAGALLFDHHYATIARLFMNKISDQQDNDNLVQQTFLDLLEYSKNYRGDVSVQTLLLIIARRKLYAHFRRQSRGRQRFDPGETSVAALDTSPSQAVAAREQPDLLNRAMRELPLQLQLMIELNYWGEVPLEDIAVIFGMSVGAVRVKLARGRKTLRQHIEQLAETPEELAETLGSLSYWVARVGNKDRIE